MPFTDQELLALDTPEKTHEEMHKCFSRATDLVDTALTEKRELTSEQEHNRKEAMADGLALETRQRNQLYKAAIELRTAKAKAEQETHRADVQTEKRERADQRAAEVERGRLGPTNEAALKVELAQMELRTKFQRYLYHGAAKIGPEKYAELELRTREEYADHNKAYKMLGLETRVAVTDPDLQSGIDTMGGYLKTPMEFVAGLIKEMMPFSMLLGQARIHRLTTPHAIAIGTKKRGHSVSFGTEYDLEANYTKDQVARLGFKVLTPVPVIINQVVSNYLLATSYGTIDALIREEFAEEFGTWIEVQICNGTNPNFLGLFNPNKLGIPTSQDVTGPLSVDSVYNMWGKLPIGRENAQQWLFSKRAVIDLHKLKDADGRPLWQPSLQSGMTSTLIGHPVNLSDYVPQVLEAGVLKAGTYIGGLVDMSKYHVAQVMGFNVNVSKERLFEKKLTIYDMQTHIGGRPMEPEYFVRWKKA